MSEVVDLTLSWCLGILVPGTPDHSGGGGAARVPQEEEALCLWLAHQAPTTLRLWEGSLVLFFCASYGQLSVWDGMLMS